MGREGDDPTVVVRSSSSIALLQERFRRLQREKQIREGRELVRGGRNVHYDPSSATTACFFFHPELVMANLRSTSPPPPLAQVVLSLWPNNNGSEVGPIKPGGQERVSILMAERSHDDIDTSLHL